MKQHYDTTKKLAWKYSKSERPDKDKEGKPITEIQQHRNRWVEYFEKLLSRSAQMNPPDIEGTHTDLPINVNPPTKEEIRMAVRQIKCGKAAGPDNIQAETLNYADNSLRSCDANREDGHKFSQCLSGGKFHSFNSCIFRNSKCFKCGDIGHIQSVCNTTVHLATTNIKSCNSDSIKLSIYNDYLSLSTILKDNVESYSSSELIETQNSCETTDSNQSTYQISYVIASDMIFS
ncbi:unnamed protein product [Schistosoma margrebowiei]|uniref:CCHC-type domain-containing protein n=1 Tax=Schistosoma margrebowiei TaxID=48269 RepID=A0A3P8FIA4_9TREM|nr:unnamed protein product [Schistosoma margrebowiei]